MHNRGTPLKTTMKTHFVLPKKIFPFIDIRIFMIFAVCLLLTTSCSPLPSKNFNLQYTATLAAILIAALLLTGVLLRKRDTRLKKQLEKSIQEARDAAILANEAKREFLSNVSHELRTPLNALMSIAYLAEESEASAFDAELLAMLHSATNKLSTIIDSILDFSSIQNGELKLVNIPFNPHKLLPTLADRCAPKAYEKGLETVFDTASDVPDALIGDPERLGQVLNYLTDNAIKFSEEGEIKVSATLAEQNEDTATLNFAIHDTGIGMTEEEIFELFQPFAQLDGSSTRRYGGLGLGLIISKQIVEKMGGEIRVESQSGEGSTFSFMVELERVSEDDPAKKTTPEADAETPAEAATPQAKGEESLDLEGLSQIFQDLAHHLEENDSLALSIMNTLRKKISSPEFQPALKQLEKLITLYEYQEAHENLTLLAEEIGISLEDKGNDQDTDDGNAAPEEKPRKHPHPRRFQRPD